MRAAVVDVGSSSIRLLIAEKNQDEIKVLESLKNVVPIGVHSFLKGRIPQEIINQTISVLERYKQVIQSYEVGDVMVIATTAVREARNKDIFVDTVFRKTGFNIDVLNVGDVVYYIDAYLSQTLKKKYPVREKNLLIAELGAGSLDLSVMEKGYTLMNIGFPVGTLRLLQFMNKLEGTQDEIYEAVEEYIEQEILHLSKITPKVSIDDIILLDDNYSSYLQNILPSKKRESNFYQFKQAECEELMLKLTESRPEEISNTFKIPHEVSETIVGYAIILNTLFKLSKQHKHINILEASLSEAIIVNLLFKAEISDKDNKTNQLISVARFLCQRYNLDLNHAEHVAEMSKKLFDGLKDALGLEDKDRLYLILAAYLHDIGIFINNRSHHKHAEYIINSLNLFRLTEDEIRIIACVARYHRKAAPMRTHILYNSLSSREQILVQKLSAILRITNSLDRSHKQKVKKLEVKFNKAQDVSIVVHTASSFLIERENFVEKKGLFEEITGNKLSLTVKMLDGYGS